LVERPLLTRPDVAIPILRLTPKYVHPRIDVILRLAHKESLHPIKVNLTKVRDAKPRVLASSEKPRTTPRRTQDRRAAGNYKPEIG
jgi:hypothetical protein